MGRRQIKKNSIEREEAKDITSEENSMEEEEVGQREYISSEERKKCRQKRRLRNLERAEKSGMERSEKPIKE